MAETRSERSQKAASPPVNELERYGWDDRWAALLDAAAVPGAVPGRVVRHDGVAVTVALADGVRQVALARAVDPPRSSATGWPWRRRPRSPSCPAPRC